MAQAPRRKALRSILAGMTLLILMPLSYLLRSLSAIIHKTSTKYRNNLTGQNINAKIGRCVLITTGTLQKEIHRDGKIILRETNPLLTV
jgi:hypothetical protein